MEQKSIKTNAILNIIYTMSNIIFPLITFPYVSRILSVELMGRVSFFQNLSSYAIMLASLGISTYGIRSVARVRDSKKELTKLAQELFIINVLASFVVVCLLLIASLFIDKFRQSFSLLCINILLIISAPLGINWLYSGLEQYSYVTKRSIVVKLFSLISIFVFVRKKTDYIKYALIVVLSSAVSYYVNFVYARRFVSYRPSQHEYRKHIKPMLLLFSSILAINVYTHLDTIMLGFLSGDEQVGLYTISVYTKTALLTAVNAISAVILPRISYYFSKNNIEEVNNVLKKTIILIIMISLPLALYFMLEAKYVIMLLGGDAFLAAVPCMRIIMPILIISGLSNVTGNQILIPMGKDSCFLRAVATGAIVDFALNCLLMPKYGSIGAAIATLIAEIIQMCIQVFYARAFIGPNVNYASIIKTIAACLCSSIILVFSFSFFAVDSIILHMVISAAVFFFIYVLVLLVLQEQEAHSILNSILKTHKCY